MRILFVSRDGKRKTIRLGKVSQRTAETVKTKVEALVAAAITGSPIEDEIARWVAGLDSGMADKLAAVGLIGRRRRETLKSFLEDYIKSRSDVKESTATVPDTAMQTPTYGTQLERIIRKAGLKPWPKLFQNLRSTRETELAESYPIQVVCEWIGNTAAVAAKHYLQTTDEHYRQALEAPASAARNPAQQLQETAGKTLQQEKKNPGISGVCEGVQFLAHHQVGGTGLEPVTSTV